MSEERTGPLFVTEGEKYAVAVTGAR